MGMSGELDALNLKIGLCNRTIDMWVQNGEFIYQNGKRKNKEMKSYNRNTIKQCVQFTWHRFSYFFLYIYISMIRAPHESENKFKGPSYISFFFFFFCTKVQVISIYEYMQSQLEKWVI